MAMEVTKTTITVGATGTDDLPVVSSGSGAVVEDNSPSTGGKPSAPHGASGGSGKHGKHHHKGGEHRQSSGGHSQSGGKRPREESQCRRLTRCASSWTPRRRG